MGVELYHAVPRRFDRRVDETEWSIWESSFSDYLLDIEQVDKKRLILSLLERLRLQNDPAVIIDLMGSFKAMRNLRHDHYLLNKMSAAVVCGFEHRAAEVQIADHLHGIDIVDGDLAQKFVWYKLKEWLGDRKANIILERGWNGLHYIPHTSAYYRFSLSFLWEMLSPDGGVMMLQTPSLKYLHRLKIDIEQWLSLLDREKIYQHYLPHYNHIAEKDAKYGLLLLQKTSEKSLPFAVHEARQFRVGPLVFSHGRGA